VRVIAAGRAVEVAVEGVAGEVAHGLPDREHVIRVPGQRRDQVEDGLVLAGRRVEAEGDGDDFR
jgi:hypothetical protein